MYVVVLMFVAVLVIAILVYVFTNNNAGNSEDDREARRIGISVANYKKYREIFDEQLSCHEKGIPCPDRTGDIPNMNEWRLYGEYRVNKYREESKKAYEDVLSIEEKEESKPDSFGKKMKNWVITAVVILGIAFLHSTIKVLVQESWRKSDEKHLRENFDDIMRRKTAEMNAKLPHRIDEYTVCNKAVYETINGRVLVNHYTVDNYIAEYIKDYDVIMDIRNDMINQIKISYIQTHEAMHMMAKNGLTYRYEYYDEYGRFLNMYTISLNDVLKSIIDTKINIDDLR